MLEQPVQAHAARSKEMPLSVLLVVVSIRSRPLFHAMLQMSQGHWNNALNHGPFIVGFKQELMGAGCGPASLRVLSQHALRQHLLNCCTAIEDDISQDPKAMVQEHAGQLVCQADMTAYMYCMLLPTDILQLGSTYDNGRTIPCWPCHHSCCCVLEP